MTKTEIFFEVTKNHAGRAVLVPATQVTYHRVGGVVTRYVGGFFLSQNMDTIAEVNVYSPTFIFIKWHTRSRAETRSSDLCSYIVNSEVKSVKESSIEDAQARLAIILD